MSEPNATRPYMPGYGIPDSTEGLFPWSWATERLTEARTYWLATARSNGQPHAMPIWAVWLDDALYFSTGAKSRKARNLADDPRCSICCELGEDQVILEGSAQLIHNTEWRRRFGDAYQAKYNWDMEGFSEPIYVVRPAVVFGFTSGNEGFTKTATRWLFEGN